MPAKPPGKDTLPPGWAEALARWRSESGPKLRRLFRSRLNSLYDADDLESQVVLNMLLYPAPRQIDNMKGYAYRVALNALNREFKKRPLEKKALRTRLHEYPQLLMGTQPPSPEVTLLLQQKLKLVSVALEKLTDKEKLVFDHWNAGETLAHISEITDMAPSTVGTHLQRALAKIRENNPPDPQE